MSTFIKLAEKEMGEVRFNDRINSVSDAFAHLHFSLQSLNDLVRSLIACQSTETESHPRILNALVNISNLAQHSAEQLNLCNIPEIEERIDADMAEDYRHAVMWMADYLLANKVEVDPIQVGGSSRFSIEMDEEAICGIVELAHVRDDV